jgi:heme exporter protein D|tara:strand:- start:604 stop:771 length:168 start_codon:yes stop_codon:yes gene_type:complete
MPDLGKYAIPVLTAYGSTILILLSVISFTIFKSRKTKKILENLESEEFKVTDEKN